MTSFIPGAVQKDKDAQLDYSFDWSDWLADGDTILSSTWEAESGIQVVTSSVQGAVATVWLDGGTPNNWYVVTNTVTTSSFPSRKDQRVLKVFVPEDVASQPPLGSALFPNRFAAIASIRADRLAVAAGGALPQVQLSDDYIWEKLLAAESTLAGRLKVALRPTHYFVHDPTPEQLAELPDGMPWDIDPAYDYDPANYRGDRWGFISLRHRPVIEVMKARFVYPAPQHVVLNVPDDWLRVDRKYGTIQFVPTSSPFLSPIGGLVMNSMAAGRQLPFSVELEYRAGLKNAARDFPELVALVKKMAVASIIEDAFLPQSGSISADGLSQSMSIDLSKYHENIDRAIDGGDGANGGLMTKIHGIRLMVM